MDKLGEIMKSFGIKKSNLAIIVIILVTAIPGVLIGLYISLYNPPIYVILGLAGILIGAGASIFGFELYRQQKKLKETDKGRKILEIRQRGYEVLPKGLRNGMVLLCFLLAFIVVIGVIYRDYMMIPAALSILMLHLIILMTERRYEIYEKGIVYGMQFIKWDEIKEIERKNELLEIKTEKVLGCIRVKDEDKRIKSIVEKYVNGG